MVLGSSPNNSGNDFGGATNEWTDSSMGRHDLYNFEAKIDYTLDDSLKQNSFSLYAYFFLPQSLQVNESTYSRPQFFADITDYMRFKTPQMAISGLLNPENRLSPLVKMKPHLESIKNGVMDAEILTEISYELRLLGSIVKACLRDQFMYFTTELCKENQCQDVVDPFTSFIQEIKQLQDAMVFLKKEFSVVQIPIELREAFNFVDTFISLRIESKLAYTLEFIQDLESFSNIRKEMISMLEYEQNHYTNLNPRVVRKVDSENQGYTYWESILKKYVQGVLFLDIKPKDQRSNSLQILYSIAAGLAMFISLYIGLAIANQFEQNSMYFIIALVVAYMLKDRIKDNMRAFSDRAMGILFADKRTEIIDTAHEEKIGDCKESMHFMNWKDVPTQIIKMREANNKSVIERAGKPENVFRYKKMLTLETNKIKDLHERHGDISNIIRFNVRHFLQYADDPMYFETMWDKDTQKLTEVACNKAYHINIIFKLISNAEEVQEQIFYKKVRVILDQQGIKQVLEPEFSL